MGEKVGHVRADRRRIPAKELCSAIAVINPVHGHTEHAFRENFT